MGRVHHANHTEGEISQGFLLLRISKSRPEKSVGMNGGKCGWLHEDEGPFLVFDCAQQVGQAFKIPVGNVQKTTAESFPFTHD